MRIVTLIENSTSREDLTAEHGLSLYVETGKHKLLFDAGQSGAFWDNGQKLGVDLTQVDTAVLSHGHYDHGDGLLRFLEENAAAPVWMSPYAFEGCYNASADYIGLDPALRESRRIRFAEDGQAIAETIVLYSRIGCKEDICPFGQKVKEGGKLVPENFRHEQYLLVEEQGKKILFSGCSHRGILNIVSWFRPDVLIGGFHFMKLDPESRRLEAAAAELKRYPCTYYTGHCTGTAQFEALKRTLGEQLQSLETGKEIIL